MRLLLASVATIRFQATGKMLTQKWTASKRYKSSNTQNIDTDVVCASAVCLSTGTNECIEAHKSKAETEHLR